MTAMAVITAASIFLVTISAGAVHTEIALNQQDIVQTLMEQDLWPKGEILTVESLSLPSETVLEMEGLQGLRLSYRLMGNQTCLLCLGDEPPSDVTVLAFRAPALLYVQGRNLAGMVEAMAW